jgi:renalase
MRIFVVGAGMAGLTAAATLRDEGFEVTVLDKGRGVGGRMATRRVGAQRFDHGAQYISAISPRFRRAMEAWAAAGVVDPWFECEGRWRYRVRGGMSALAKHMGAGLHIRTSARVEHLEATGKQWRLTLHGGEEEIADAVVLTPPAPQSIELLGPLAAGLPARLKSVRYAPCFALMLALDGPSAVPGEGFVRPDGGVLSWVADNCRKGVSDGEGALTLHATPEFSKAMYEAPSERVEARMTEAAKPWLGGAAIRESQLHRWRYSLVEEGGPEPCFPLPGPAPLILAGDAFGPPRIEGAYLSGYAAALWLLESA